jgi:hypothetical protein
MFNLTVFKKLLDSKNISFVHFLRLHFAVEALFMRMLLIGLRLKGIQYKTAVEAVGIYTVKKKKEDILKKAWELCGFNYTKDINSNKKYRELKDLYLHFSAPYRNKLVHGAKSSINDEELLSILISIDKSFIETIESIAKSKGESFFNEPKTWGTKNGKINNIEQVFKTVFNQKVSDISVLTLQEAKKRLEAIEGD